MSAIAPVARSVPAPSGGGLPRSEAVVVQSAGNSTVGGREALRRWFETKMILGTTHFRASWDTMDKMPTLRFGAIFDVASESAPAADGRRLDSDKRARSAARILSLHHCFTCHMKIIMPVIGTGILATFHQTQPDRHHETQPIASCLLLSANFKSYYVQKQDRR